ncbi:MAG: aldo/keto reductase [Spirochaetaceae bacterium]|nr:MAG: aldo/keto reductase [Spirochaetaceae bacterium]
MDYRPLGSTGMNVSEISFGAWAIGADWGDVDDSDARAALRRARELGVNFFDTADVYGAGRSEKFVAELKKEDPDNVFFATKAGRRLNPHTAEQYTPANITAFVEDSLRNMGLSTLDLVQLHCPPTDVYYNPELFAALDALVQQGKIRHYGVSVEKVEEALKAIEYPGVESVQIIFNTFRLRPAERFFNEARARNIGIIARVPLASGLLTGRMSATTEFARSDHRNFNRNGEAFDVGETFSGVPFEVGLAAVEELKQVVPEGMSLTQFALRWILSFDAVSCAIPGAKRPSQVEENVAAAELSPLTDRTLEQVRRIYDQYIREHVHHRW